MRRSVYIAAGYSTIFMGKGRPEFANMKQHPSFEAYLIETAQGTCKQVGNPEFDEGIIASFLPGRFINQAHIAGFLPFIVPSLLGKPCTGIEAACCSGGRAIAMAIRTILSGMAESVFVAGFEIQNSVKAVYGADILAAASYYRRERKDGHAFFFPGVFAERAKAYFDRYGHDGTRDAMARWYEQMIRNARRHPKAQEHFNQSTSLYELGMTPPNPERFLPYLNVYDCSKVSDGAASLLVLSEEGLARCGIEKNQAIEVIGIGEAEADITKPPKDPTRLSNVETAVKKALSSAQLTLDDIAILEIHDCFTITAIMMLEAIGAAPYGRGGDAIRAEVCTLQGTLPTNLSGGLIGYGHPTGATGVRQMVDVLQQLTQTAPDQSLLKSPYGMAVNMGGNDITATSIITRVAGQ